MAPHLMTIIRQYHLAPRIGYFTGDNDAKNDTCLRQLAVELSQDEDALQAAIAQAQHETNDVTVADALHDQIQSNTCHKSHDRRKKRHDTAGWRSIGPMGKLHNIAVFIRNSTVRNDAWDDIAEKALGIDNITRWNSWFKLLDAAISQEGPLSIFLNQYHNELEDDILTHDDWQVLKMTHEFLQPFYQATLEQQMEWASIDQVLENMDILFMQFENAKMLRRSLHRVGNRQNEGMKRGADTRRRKIHRECHVDHVTPSIDLYALAWANTQWKQFLFSGPKEAAEPAQHSHSSSKIHGGNQAPRAIRSDIAPTA
ncbi:hypothetical protein MPH_13851 [Macrophomina phaseolina MS6]|uniref:Transposase-like protein n=1 Tax=Macrophomina phaseolina (strain MS6) TaxID=1126212 RepID=K2RXL1_MACPH|nr:hypothetical protein MPH_13851 [Macrophomina phaseolina MS6]